MSKLQAQEAFSLMHDVVDGKVDLPDAQARLEANLHLPTTEIKTENVETPPKEYWWNKL